MKKILMITILCLSIFLISITSVLAFCTSDNSCSWRCVNPANDNTWCSTCHIKCGERCIWGGCVVSSGCSFKRCDESAAPSCGSQCTTSGEETTTKTQSCGKCGTRSCSCSVGTNCLWSCGTCTGEKDCYQGEAKPCGNCGTETCGKDCRWSGVCANSGPCSPGATQSCPITNQYGTCTGTQTCTSSCSFGSCSGQTPAAEICDGSDNDCDGSTDEQCQIISSSWSNMQEQSISNAEKKDLVKLVASSEELLKGKSMTFDVYKSNTLFGAGILDWIIPDNKVTSISKNVEQNGKSIAVWQLPDISSKTYYYAYAHVESISSKASLSLEVSAAENNSKPVSVITTPSYSGTYKFSKGSSVSFTQSSYDIDDEITYLWDFGDSTLTSPLANPSHSYSVSGPKYATLNITDSRGKKDSAEIGILIDDIAVDDEPLAVFQHEIRGLTDVYCDASKSIDDIKPLSKLTIKWFFDNVEDKTYENITSFTKTFYSAGTHTIEVEVDDA